MTIERPGEAPIVFDLPPTSPFAQPSFDPTSTTAAFRRELEPTPSAPFGMSPYQRRQTLRTGLDASERETPFTAAPRGVRAAAPDDDRIAALGLPRPEKSYAYSDDATGQVYDVENASDADRVAIIATVIDEEYNRTATWVNDPANHAHPNYAQVKVGNDLYFGARNAVDFGVGKLAVAFDGKHEPPAVAGVGSFAHRESDNTLHVGAVASNGRSLRREPDAPRHGGKTLARTVTSYNDDVFDGSAAIRGDPVVRREYTSEDYYRRYEGAPLKGGTWERAPRARRPFRDDDTPV
jgi:hypothetical protein